MRGRGGVRSMGGIRDVGRMRIWEVYGHGRDGCVEGMRGMGGVGWEEWEVVCGRDGMCWRGKMYGRSGVGICRRGGYGSDEVCWRGGCGDVWDVGEYCYML